MSIIWPLFQLSRGTQYFRKAMISILKIEFISVSQYLFIEHHSIPVNTVVPMDWEGRDTPLSLNFR